MQIEYVGAPETPALTLNTDPPIPPPHPSRYSVLLSHVIPYNQTRVGYR